MAATARDLITAGALAQMCNRHATRDEPPKDWTETRLYAIRTFRDVPIEEIDKFIRECQLASENAERLMTGRECFPCGLSADLSKSSV